MRLSIGEQRRLDVLTKKLRLKDGKEVFKKCMSEKI
jgi:hypothetical protein